MKIINQEENNSLSEITTLIEAHQPIIKLNDDPSPPENISAIPPQVLIYKIEGKLSQNERSTILKAKTAIINREVSNWYIQNKAENRAQDPIIHSE